MEKYLVFVSRHAPTVEQSNLAAKAGFVLVHVGDVDAFSPTQLGELMQKNGYNCFNSIVAVVHPMLAMQALGMGLGVAVFENGNRVLEGEKPSFFAKAMHIVSPLGLDCELKFYPRVEL